MKNVKLYNIIILFNSFKTLDDKKLSLLIQNKRQET